MVCVRNAERSITRKKWEKERICNGLAIYDKEKDFKKVFEEADAQMYTKKQNKKQS